MNKIETNCLNELVSENLIYCKVLLDRLCLPHGFAVCVLVTGQVERG